ncbi:hypothetical protein [Streptomyces sp. NPDC008121]|uniref:hypothetical protein n=1 Tax=Streptomyces sp. NPDC008121 TaxID=3364809 RepID=UPI0036EC3CBE
MKKTSFAVAAAAVGVFSLAGSGAVWAAGAGPSHCQDTRAGQPCSRLTFLGLASAAVGRMGIFEGAELLEGRGVSPSGSTSDVTGITDWEFIFRLPGNRHAVIQATSGGDFSDPALYSRPWLGSQALTWNPSDFIDIGEADSRLKHAGYTGTYDSVTFRKPLYPGVTQPSYIFGLSDGSRIAVGAADGAVVPFR